MNPEDRSWIVQEKYFQPQQQHYYETILTIGNGYLGTRATFEEGYPDELASTLVHGVFNHHSDDLVPDLANVPSWFDMDIVIEGTRFQLNHGKLLGYHRQLDLRNGVLWRGVLWQSPTGKVFRIHSQRFASMDNPNLLVQHIHIKALSDIESCTIDMLIQPDKAMNIAYAEGGPKMVSHWDKQAFSSEGGRVGWSAITNQSGYQVALLQDFQIEGNGYTATPFTTSNRVGASLQRNGQSEFALATGEEIIITRLTAIATSRDTDDLAEFSSTILNQQNGKTYADLLEENERVWADLWADFDIEIEGDEFAQLAIRFVAFHLLITASPTDEHVSIGAKTLSGPGYKGHVFWDTELFMLPPFTLSRPAIARNLLMYRYHNLAGARHKAAEAGYKGAMFPWESTDTGEETTPRWTLPDEKGNRIRIWTGDHEQHISSDIAFSIWHYWQWTGDDTFLCNYGAEIFLDTAVFWASRVEWNPTDNRYELNMQIGPDEFHENINNSVYTNSLVVWHLRHAKKVLDWLGNYESAQYDYLCQTLGIDDDLIAKWQHIAENMYIPRHQQLDVYEQFNGYFDLNYVDVEAYTPRTKSLDVILGHEKTVASQVIKQADVVMLIALLGEELGNRDELLRNWHIYVPRTAHDSSLSSAIHAWVAAQLGLEEEAYDLWIKSAGIDLDNTKGNVRDGMHAAACGGLRQAIIFGFAGLHLDENRPEGWALRPRLPQWWKSVKFSFYYRGKKHTVMVE